jgi:hypothetical protein
VAFKIAGQGATLEASVPLRALPRMSAAPVTSLVLAARSVAAPALPAPEQWAALELPEPVGFEPWAELRALAFGAEMGTGYYRPNTSYHPAEPLRLETLSYAGEMDRRDYAARDGALYARRMSLGELEIGVVQGSADHVAVLRRGKVVAVHGRRGGTLVDMVPRDGEVHVFVFDVETATDTFMTSADWTLLAIGPDGALREKVLDEPPNFVPWAYPKEFHSPDLQTFGVRGGWYSEVDGKDTTTGWERTWRWDKAQRRYVLKEKRIPLPPQNKKRR